MKNSQRLTVRSAPALAKPLAVLLTVAVLSGCAGYVPGAQSYWDARVKDMCEKGGGVNIYQTLHLSKEEMDRLPRVDDFIDVPIKRAAKPDTPAYAEITVTIIHEHNPQVTRTEAKIIRQADKVVVARWIVYSRFGGDFPSPSHPSTFRCPKLRKINADLQPLFEIQAGSK